MARITKAEIEVIINDEKASQKMKGLAADCKQFGEDFKAASKKGDTEAMKAIQAELNRARKELAPYAKQVVDVEAVLKNLNKVSLNDLNAAQRKLRGEIRGLERDSDDYKIKAQQLVLVQQELGVSAASAAPKVGSLLSRLRNFGFVFDISSVVQKVIGGVSRAIDAYASYDDKLADAMKTTGLAKDKAEELSVSLSKIDTRSSQEELLGLAEQAGKLVLSGAKDVENFTIAADKIGVALGKDLGDKEQAINSLGKMTDIFKLKDEFGMGEAMLKLGSAVNALGAASTANEGYIVDFASRTGGIGVSANISAANILGLGATFDSLGQQSEASATVINKVIVGMFSKTSQYANVAKMDVKEFTTLLKTDANEALLRVMEGMRGGDLGEIASMLGEVGENGSRAAQATVQLANNVDMLRVQQEIARREFELGTSVSNEFDIKNNTAAARREKQQKEYQKTLVELGRTIQPIVDAFYDGAITAAQAVKSLIGFLWEVKVPIMAITATMVVYNVQKKLSAFWSAANATAIKNEISALKGATAGTVAHSLASKALLVIKALLVGQFKAAGIAAKAFLVSLGPIGWIITGIGLAVTAVSGAIAIFSDKTDAAAQSAKDLSDVQTKASQAIIAEKIELESLLRVASDKTISDDARLQAMKKLQELMPDGIHLINQETIANGKAKIAIDDYCASLLVRAQLEAAKDLLVEKEKERLQKMQSGEAYEMDWWQYTKVWISNFSVFKGTSEKMLSGYMSENSQKFRAKADAESNYLTTLIDGLNQKILAKKSPADGSSDPNPCSKCGKTPCECYKGDAGKKQAWTLDNDTEFGAKRVALKRRLLEGDIASDEQYNRQTLAIEIMTLENRIALKKDKGAELAKLNEQLLDKQLQQTKDNKKREEALLKQVQGDDDDYTKASREYDEKKKALGLYGRDLATMTATEKAALLSIEKAHASKISSIRLSQMQDAIEKQQKEIERKATNVRLAQAAELASADTFEQKKALLKKWLSDEEIKLVTDTKQADKLIKAKFAEEEQAATKEDLTKLLSFYQAAANIMSATGGLLGSPLGGMVKMTDEDRQKLEDIIAKLRANISKLNNDPVATPNKKERKQADVLGMTADDWSTMFKNTENGLSSMDKMAIAAKAIGSAFSDVSNLMAAIEARDLKNYEKSQDKKKRALDKQLKAGVISQETYNQRVQAIDEQTEAKRIEIERKQAERQKMLAIFQALVNTAVAITSALAQGGPIAGPILAGIIGALGAIQVAAIIAQPLPGAETGGMLVERTQDNKRFNAEFEPHKRGAVSSPTVIVGENGTEYVVPADGYANPTIRPMLDILERARINGTLRNMDFTAMWPQASMQGKVKGGHVNEPAKTDAAITYANQSNELAAAVKSMTDAANTLTQRLERPIEAVANVSIAGKGGLAQNLDKFNELKSRSRINSSKNA